MGKFLEFISNFLTNHLIPAFISIIGVAVVTYNLPETSQIRIRLGDILFYVSTFSLFFVAIKFIIWLYNLLKGKLLDAQEQNAINEFKKSQIEKMLDEYMTIVDSLKPTERKILERFISTNNESIPVNVITKAYYTGSFRSSDNTPLYDSAWLDKTYIEKDGEHTEYAKLKPYIFDALTACKETRGSISHFKNS